MTWKPLDWWRQWVAKTFTGGMRNDGTPMAIVAPRVDPVDWSFIDWPIVELCTGPQPANCAAPDRGELLAVCSRIDRTSATRGGFSGTWEGTGLAKGIADHFRVRRPDGTCDMQGTMNDLGLWIPVEPGKPVTVPIALSWTTA